MTDSVIRAQLHQIGDMGLTISLQRDLIRQLRGELERARDLAVALEQEIDLAVRAIEALAVAPIGGLQWVRRDDVLACLAGRVPAEWGDR